VLNTKNWLPQNRERVFIKKESTRGTGMKGRCWNCHIRYDFQERNYREGKKPWQEHFCSASCYIQYDKRRKYRGEDWEDVRRKVMERDKGCIMLGCRNKSLQVHHTIPWRICKRNEPKELVTLCAKHHSQEETRMIKFYKPSKRVRDYLSGITGGEG
jgi:5-methylcytosine-specific restriction endonuclease McrA